MNLRQATSADLPAIRQVIEAAFSEKERGAVGDLAAALLAEGAQPPVLSLVAECENGAAGFISFSPITVTGAPDITGYILAPLAVLPQRQKQGIGAQLIGEGKRILSARGVDAILVYGDPAYYGRFGFNEEVARPFVPPYALTYPFGWLGLILSDKLVGETRRNAGCVAALNRPELW